MGSCLSTDSVARPSKYATAEQLWTWNLQKWHGAAEELRRNQTPSVYTQLAQVVVQNGGRTGAGSRCKWEQSQLSDIKIFDDAKFSIVGDRSCKKGHQIQDCPICRPFYGPIAERAIGIRIASGEEEESWQRIFRGASSIPSIDKMTENFLVVNDPHAKVYDHLSGGVLTTIPICEMADALSWDQGGSYDILVVADTAETYDFLHVTNREGILQRASPTEIESATRFLGKAIAALVDILASDQNILLGPMEQILNEEKDGKFEEKIVGHRKTMREQMLPTLWKLREKIRTTGKGMALMPDGVESRKPVLKIDMKKYMEVSGVGQYTDGNYPFADPLLVAFKAAINAYFGKTGDKLLPACAPPAVPSWADDDYSAGDSDLWIGDDSTTADSADTLQDVLMVTTQEIDPLLQLEVKFELPVVSDDEEDYL